jgi:hypothetical protein
MARTKSHNIPAFSCQRKHPSFHDLKPTCLTHKEIFNESRTLPMSKPLKHPFLCGNRQETLARDSEQSKGVSYETMSKGVSYKRHTLSFRHPFYLLVWLWQQSLSSILPAETRLRFEEPPKKDPGKYAAAEASRCFHSDRRW